MTLGDNMDTRHLLTFYSRHFIVLTNASSVEAHQEVTVPGPLPGCCFVLWGVFYLVLNVPGWEKPLVI